jgi:outer membrane protein
MKRHVLALALACALMGHGASSASTLDLVQAFRLAQANDPQVASARAQLETVRARAEAAQAALRPSVNSTLNSQLQHYDPEPGRTRDFQPTTLGVQLSYPLFRLQNVEALEQSRLQVTASEIALELAQQDLILRVSQAYFDLLGSQDNLATIRAQKRAITEQLAAARRNFEVGTATITDQQEAQARFDLATAQELSALNDVEVKRAALGTLIGRAFGDIHVLRPGVTLEGPQPAQETNWTSAARDNNYNVQQQRISSEVARREIERQRAATQFTVDLVGSVTHQRNSTVSTIGTTAMVGAVGIQIAKPLYTGGGADARVREALSAFDKSRSDLETAQRQAELSARQSFYVVNSGLAQIRALEAAERSSQLALDSNLLGYQVGVRINIDVLNAQQQLFTTRRDLARARYEAILNGLRLRTTSASLKETDLTQVNALLVPAPSPAPAPAPGPSSGSQR